MKIDEKEFEKIIDKYKSSIYTVCYMFSNDSDEVKDLFQDVLINLWKGIDKFQNRSAMSTWIWRVSLNTCVSYDRKRKKTPTVPLTMDIDLFDDNDRNLTQIKILHNRINRLRPFDRAIILLWLESMSYEEIGAIVGITAKNVSARLFRIKEELKQMSNINE